MEPMEEEEEVDKEVNMGEVPPTRDSVPEQAPAPLVTLLVVAGIWVGGQVTRWLGKGQPPA